MNGNYIPPKTMSELLERYKNGERDFVECDLYDECYDLRNLNLEGINLSKTFIFADFRGANLKGANFYQANVKTCDFRRADLTNATFENSAIDSALFDGAILENTNFENAGTYGYSMKKGESPDWSIMENKRDIDEIIEAVKKEFPNVEIYQLKVTHSADDDGIWYFWLGENSDDEIHVENSYG